MCALQMYAYVATYQMPNDDPERLLEPRSGSSIRSRPTRRSAFGTTPTLRLQRAFGTPGRFKRVGEARSCGRTGSGSRSRTGPSLYVLLRHRDQFPGAAARIYATFDLGVIGYWAIPTAPPWFAAQRGLMEDGRTPELRRMMVEYGEQFWKQGWAPLYGVLGGNPLAAMPSLHFATSVTAAHVLADTGRVAGVLGWAYAATLGLALVYLGEHYVVDLVAGLALAEGIRARDAGSCRRRRTRALEDTAGTRGEGARMTRAPEQTVDQPSPGDDEHDDDDDAPSRVQRPHGPDAVRLPGRGDPRALPAAAAAGRPGGHLEPDRGRLAGLDRARLRAHVRDVRRLRRDVPRRLRRTVDRIGRQRELPDHDGRAGGVADLRRRRRRRARPAGLGAAPGRAGASASSPTRRSPSSS